MATYSKQLLSGSTDGKGIKVAATAIASGTTIHTADASARDLVTLFVQNNDTTDLLLTLGWGGTTDPDDLIKATVPAQAGLALLVYKQPIKNSLVIKAAAATANKLVIFGSVDRIS